MKRWCCCAVIAGSLFVFVNSGCTKQSENTTPSVPMKTPLSDAGKSLKNVNGVTAETESSDSTKTDQHASQQTDRGVPEGSGDTGNGLGTESRVRSQSPNNAPDVTSARENGLSGGSVNRATEASGRVTPLDPRAAEARATRLIAEAEQAQQDGKTAKAYRLAVSAWEAVRVHKGDARCQELEELLLKTVQQLGEALNNNAAGVDRRAPVTVK